MSVLLGSLEDFLEEPVTQELPCSFLVHSTFALNQQSGAPSSRFANWRRGVATRFTIARQKMHEAQQRNAAKKHAESSAPMQTEVDALKGELEALRNEMRMMRGVLKVKKGSNGSSGGETNETAASDPSGFGLPIVVLETADSDEERELGSMDHTTTQSGFGDDRFLGWSATSEPSGFGLPVVIRETTDSDEQRGVRSLDLTPMGHVRSDASQAGFGDDGFHGW